MLGIRKFVKSLKFTKENIYEILRLAYQLAAYLIKVLVEQGMACLKKGETRDRHSD